MLLQVSERGPTSTEGGGGGLWLWLKKLSHKLRRPDEESYVCYILFVLLFIADFSILALVLQVALFCYALLAQFPSRIFWQVHPLMQDKSHISIRPELILCKSNSAE